MHVNFSKETCLNVWNRIHKLQEHFRNRNSIISVSLVLPIERSHWPFLALSLLQYSQIPEFLKIAAKSTFGRNIPWKIIDFFRRENGFKKCILSEIGLIRHWNKKTNLIITCLNFKLELTEHIRNRNSIFVGLVYASVYWLRLCIRFYDSWRGKQRYEKRRIV